MSENRFALAVSRSSGGELRLAAARGEEYVDLEAAGRTAGVELPGDLATFVRSGEELLERAIAATASADVPALVDPRLEPPIVPGARIFAVGQNYQEHIDEIARSRQLTTDPAQRPTFFSKLFETAIGDGAAIELDPAVTGRLDYEAELVVVIGADGRDISRAAAMDYVFGYTIGNDVSARDLQQAHGQWFKGKNLDTFAPLGPHVVPARLFRDPHHRRIRLHVNGELRQDASTADMIFDIPRIIEELSAGLTLRAGDLIMTGTPSGVGMGMSPQQWLSGGDVVEAEVEGIGVLTNRVEQVGAS